MTKKRPKTTDALMRYLREEKGISISGSSQKRKLMNIGYYHGYKGYRYIGKASNSIHYTNFDELMAVYEFDAQLKALFYPYVMQIETALKSYVLEVVVSQVNSDSFIDVYNKLLDNYKAFSTAGSVYSDFKQRKRQRINLNMNLNDVWIFEIGFIRYRRTRLGMEIKLQNTI